MPTAPRARRDPCRWTSPVSFPDALQRWSHRYVTNTALPVPHLYMPLWGFPPISDIGIWIFTNLASSWLSKSSRLLWSVKRLHSYKIRQTGLEKSSQVSKYHTPTHTLTMAVRKLISRLLTVLTSSFPAAPHSSLKTSSSSPSSYRYLLATIYSKISRWHLNPNEEYNSGSTKPDQKYKVAHPPWRSGRGRRRRSFEDIQGFCVGAFRCKPEPASWHRERCMLPLKTNQQTKQCDFSLPAGFLWTSLK